MINKKDISIGVVQFAVNTENNSHLLADNPLGSVSRMFAEIISENLLFLGIYSDIASLIISKPEEKTHKQLMYTSMLPIETVRKIFEGQYYDYLIFGEIKFENTFKVEITLINSLDDKSFRRELSLKNYDFFEMSTKIIYEVFKLINFDMNLDQLNNLTKYSSDYLKSWGWYSLAYEEELDNADKIVALEKAVEASDKFDMAKLKLLILNLEEHKYKVKNLSDELKDTDLELINYFAYILEAKKEYLAAYILLKVSYEKKSEQSLVLEKLIKLSEKNDEPSKTNYYLEDYLIKVNDQDFNYEEIPLQLYMSGKTQVAIEKAKKGEKIKPDSAKIHSTLAYIYMNENDFENSESEYEKSFSLARDVNVLEDWSSVLLKNNKNEKLVDVINKYSDDLPFNSGLSCNLAIAHINLNQKERAIEVLERAVKSDKDNVRLNSLLGNIYLEKKSYARAQKYFYSAIQNDPENYNWYINMGNLYFEQEDFKEAEKYYIRAKTIKNDLKIAQQIICQAYQLKKEEKYQDAMNKFIQASKLSPDLFLAKYEIANLFFENQSIDEAIEFLEKDLEKFSREPKLWNLLSKIYTEKGNSFFGKKWKAKANEATEKYNALIKK